MKSNEARLCRSVVAGKFLRALTCDEIYIGTHVLYSNSTGGHAFNRLQDKALSERDGEERSFPSLEDNDASEIW